MKDFPLLRNYVLIALFSVSTLLHFFCWMNVWNYIRYEENIPDLFSISHPYGIISGLLIIAAFLIYMYSIRRNKFDIIVKYIEIILVFFAIVFEFLFIKKHYVNWIANISYNITIKTEVTLWLNMLIVSNLIICILLLTMKFQPKNK
jgi:hypothetical protein